MVVQEMTASGGAVVRFHDDCYVQASVEEINQRVNMFLEIAAEILLDAEIDKSENAL